MDSEKELIEQRLNGMGDAFHSPYEAEIAFYLCVQAGDISTVTTMLDEVDSVVFQHDAGRGHLSDDPLRNMAYHVVITIAMVSRFCLAGGMDHQSAYLISNLYTQQVDRAQTLDQLRSIRRHACLDYARRMNQHGKEKVMSKPVMRAVDYINAHLQNRLTVPDIAGYVGLHPSYMSAVFANEMGTSISQYIRLRKVALAKNMLSYAAYSSLRIANYLSFSSQSHFIQVFKKITGLTPEQYRRHHYRNSWMKRASEKL